MGRFCVIVAAATVLSFGAFCTSGFLQELHPAGVARYS
jgi:hypothetical protein